MQPLMPKATAVWLVDNTTLTFEQIAEFVGMHPLEVSGIADGEVAQGMKGFDPIANNQLTREEIARCEKDPNGRLRAIKSVVAPEQKKKAPRYTPLSKRLDRPAAIAWLVRNHAELSDAQISKMLGTTKTTIEAIRNRTHWNSNNIQPVDPVALGLCRQIDLDAAVKLAAERKAAEAKAQGLEVKGPTAGLAPVSETLRKRYEDFGRIAVPGAAAPVAAAEPEAEEEDDHAAEQRLRSRVRDMSPDSLFNLPSGGGAEDDEDDADDAPANGRSAGARRR